MKSFSVAGSINGIGIDASFSLDANNELIASEGFGGLQLIGGKKGVVFGVPLGIEGIVQLDVEIDDEGVALTAQGEASIGFVFGEVEIDTSTEIKIWDFDTSELGSNDGVSGLDIDTSFEWGGALYGGSFWQSEDTEAIAQGFAIDGGNYSVFSQTVNDTGFWSIVNHPVTEGYQPARGNVVGSLVTDDVWDIMMSPDLLSGSLDNVGRFSLAALPSFTNDLAKIDPLVLDLDGDGVELTPYNEGRVFFDIDNGGALERTGWVGADDGMLVHDLNGNGQIDDVTETLSEYYGAAAGTGAIYASGFDALATLDGNNDGVIDAQDAAYASLRVWRDADSDGVTDAGELTGLAAAGIQSLDLSSTADGSFTGGNEVRANGSYRRTDGTSHGLASINFIADPNGLIESADGTGKRFDDQAGQSIYAAGDGGETVNLAAISATGAIGGTGNDVLTGDAGFQSDRTSHGRYTSPYRVVGTN